jgi:SAM-dependent methyltransferase
MREKARRTCRDERLEMIDVEAAYRIWSATYDTSANRTRDLDASVLRESGLVRVDRDVVELGCGTGKNSVWLVEGCRSLIALDVSEEMLARARLRVPDACGRFVRHDLRTAWPLGDASADLVVGNLVLEHVRDLDPIFREAARALRPDGELYVSEFHPFRQLQGGGAKIAAHGDARVEVYPHDVSEFVNAALDAGFRIERLGEHRDADGLDRGVAMPRLLTISARRLRSTTRS